MIYGSDQEHTRVIWEIAHRFFSEDVVAILDQRKQELDELMRQSRELPPGSCDDSFGLEIHRFTPLLSEKMKQYVKNEVRERLANGMSTAPQAVYLDACNAIIELMFPSPLCP
jgi:hypothetical protein